MADFDTFARWLIACQRHPDADGCIAVHLADAMCLREIGFWNVEPGRWKAPSLPPEIIDRYPALAEFRMTLPDATAGQPRTPSDRQDATIRPAKSAIIPVDAVYVGISADETSRLHWALANSDHCRIVASLFARPDCGCTKRQLQQRLHRMRARDLNAALERLTDAGVVLQRAGRVELRPTVQRSLNEAVGTVSRPRARARRAESSRRTGPEVRTGETDLTQIRDAGSGPVRPSKTSGPRRYQPRPVPDRRRHPSAWGRSMRAKRGGLAVQRRYRSLGVQPTAAAMEARQRKRTERQRRQSVVRGAAVIVAPSATAVGPTPDSFRNPVPQPSVRASAISAALAYNQPIGRRERLTERKRR
jgi:hypothetical protein